MRICSECFFDEEIQNYISSTGVKGVCDVLKKDALVIELEDLSDFFYDVINVFKIEASSKNTIVDYLQKDWNLFRDKKVAEKIINECVSMLGSTLDIKHVVYLDVISNYVSIWERLKHDLQFKSRFLINLNTYNPTDPYLKDCIKADVIIPTGTIMYRARVLPDKVSYYKKDDLGCPPPKIVSNGRANPIGIPYLYLCDNKGTTYYEVRARYKDRVTVGDFRINRNLKIVSLSSLSSLYLASHSGDFVKELKHKLLLHKIAEDMTKPLSRYDTELEYVPTQFICELCKINGADGISFKSSLDGKGTNYVLFSANDKTVAECIKVNTVTIEHVEIKP